MAKKLSGGEKYMPYKSFPCPFCGGELLNATIVREVAQATVQFDNVGTSAMLAKCRHCGQQTGILIASDKNAWLMLPTPPENLQELYYALRALMKKGAPVATIAKHFEKILPTFKVG